jgi:hypothetical protein
MKQKPNRRDVLAAADVVYRIGQRVQYVDDRWPAAGRYQRETVPTRGWVYTVREILPCKAFGYDEDGLRHVEIVNPVILYATPLGPATFELTFRVSRFRPVRTTNIDVFLEMLVPARVTVEQTAGRGLGGSQRKKRIGFSEACLS